jgi:hypothetical protein
MGFLPFPSTRSLLAVLLVISASLSGSLIAGGKSDATRDGQDHWAFQPLTHPAVPEVKNEQWAKTNLDRFILARQEAVGLQPNLQLDARHLIRRVYFDLIGLPPTEAEIEAFVKDSSPAAYERLVQSLLASPRYGERWGRHWLDLARYADSKGYRYDDNTTWAWAYRDFVIRAYNEDMPFDEFMRWQIAGDEFAPDRRDALVATGFCAVGPIERNEGTKRNKQENRYNELDDVVSTLGSSALALTIGCARCHDHKFDPITQREYYSLAGAFMAGSRREIDLLTSEEHRLLGLWSVKLVGSDKQLSEWRKRYASVVDPVIKEKSESLQETINDLTQEFKNKLAKRSDKPKGSFDEMLKEYGEDLLGKPKLRRLDEARKDLAELTIKLLSDASVWKDIVSPAALVEIQQLQKQRQVIEAGRPVKPLMAQAYVDTSNEAVPSPLLARGSIDAPQEPVGFGVLHVLGNDAEAPQQRANSTGQRAALANWLTDADNGAGFLMARVLVNRLWYHHFGEGLVRSLNDFGVQGDKPAMPELLDWLANELIAKKWRLKDMHRLILMSAVYQQDVTYDDKRAAIDPENRFWWKRRPMRLEAVRWTPLFGQSCGKLSYGAHGVGR